MKKKKIALICNDGGHFVQLRLAAQLLPREKFDIYWVTADSKHLQDELKDVRHYVFANPSTDKMNWLVNGVQTIALLAKERPDAIVSTGAGIAYLSMLLGKYLFGCKLIFICSAANVTKPSRMPYRAYRLCDRFFVQWPEMKKVFPKAEYIGLL